MGEALPLVLARYLEVTEEDLRPQWERAEPYSAGMLLGELMGLRRGERLSSRSSVLRELQRIKRDMAP